MGTKSNKFIPFHEVYNKILWDDRYNPVDYFVVYLDRAENKFKYLRVDIYKHSDVPQHRILRIVTSITEAKVVWDRENRLYNL